MEELRESSPWSNRGKSPQVFESGEFESAVYLTGILLVNWEPTSNVHQLPMHSSLNWSLIWCQSVERRMGIFSFWDGREISNLTPCFSELNLQVCWRTRKASSDGICYVITPLKIWIRWSTFHSLTWNQQPTKRDGLRFQNRILHRQRDSEVELITAIDMQTSTNTKSRESDQSRDKERFFFIKRNKNLRSHSTENRFHCGFKNGLQADRQTDKTHIYRLTEPILSV